MTDGAGPARPAYAPRVGLHESRRNLLTLEEAVAAVESTLDSPHLRVDRRLAREDADHYLLLVLDTSGSRQDEVGPVANGPRLVAKDSGQVVRLTVTDALARADRMALVHG